jgi:hypothetical protein
MDNDGKVMISAQSYLFDKPLFLPKYLKQFGVDDKFNANNIVGGSAISICIGVGEQAHWFLTHEGCMTCDHCGEKICQHCCSTINEERIYCLSCSYATNTAVPLSGCDGSKTIAEMQRELKEQYNFDHVEKLQLDDVKEAYEKMDIVQSYNCREFNVPFPIYATIKLDKLISGSKIFTSWSTIADVDLQYRGAFLADSSIDTHYIPGVLVIFGSLVTYDKGKSSRWMKKVSNTMPAILLQFATQSCLSCG